MEHREIDWDAIVKRAREQDEARSAIKPVMNPKALRNGIVLCLAMVAVGFTVGHFWPW